MYIRIDPDAWAPELPGVGGPDKESTGRLKPGTIIVWGRKAYRVVEVRERVQANWPDKYRDEWVKQGMPDPDTWRDRPRVVVLQSEDEPTAKERGLEAGNSYRWFVLPEHYPICRRCQEIPPCRHVHTERVMDRATERMDRDMALMPGVCHGCREPITKRQKHFTFPGTNLIRPDLGDNTAAFHTRRSCYNAIDSYDRRWAAAEPGRSRLFYCTGTITVHHDDSRQCTEPACIARGDHADLVQHAMWLRHHPQMQEARGCWCLAGLF